MCDKQTLEEMQREVYEVNAENGWFDNGRTFGDEMALLHSEVSEALEAYRTWGFEDKTLANHNNRISKPEGIGSEFADILIRLLDVCERYHIDLRFEYERKIEYNRTRGYHHGGKAL